MLLFYLVDAGRWVFFSSPVFFFFWCIKAELNARKQKCKLLMDHKFMNLLLNSLCPILWQKHKKMLNVIRQPFNYYYCISSANLLFVFFFVFSSTNVECIRNYLFGCSKIKFKFKLNSGTSYAYAVKSTKNQKTNYKIMPKFNV